MGGALFSIGYKQAKWAAFIVHENDANVSEVRTGAQTIHQVEQEGNGAGQRNQQVVPNNAAIKAKLPAAKEQCVAKIRKSTK